MGVNPSKRAIFVIGFLSVFLGIIIARSVPATGPEVSIYAKTPFLFWVLLSISLSISIIVSITSPLPESYKPGFLLGGLSVFTVVSLPLIRGYHFMGRGDAMTHLGRASDVKAGLLALHDLRYPIVHSWGIVLSHIGGVPLTQALMIVVLLFVLVFITYVPLATILINHRTEVLIIGVFSSLLLLPINHLGVHNQIHPNSQAVMFTPFLFYLFQRSISEKDKRFIGIFSSIGLFYVFLHPQHAANLLMFLTAVSGLVIGLYLVDWSNDWQDFLIQKRLVLSVFILGLIWWLWVQNLFQFEVSISRIVMNFYMGNTAIAESVHVRSVSLKGVGGSMYEVFLKLFFVSLIYCVFCGAIMLRSFLTPIDRVSIGMFSFDSKFDHRVITLYSAGFIPVLVVFLIYIFQGISDQYFRHLGFLMVIVTIIGTIAIDNMIREFVGYSKLSRWSLVIFFIFCVGLSIPIIFGSPYLYQNTSHVSHGELSGYEMLFENQDKSIQVAPRRGNTERIEHAIYGLSLHERPNFTWDRPRRGLPDHFANQSLPGHYDSPVYAVMKSDAEELEIEVWNEFRYTQDDFQYLDRDSHIQKVQSNGQIEVYLVNNA